MASLELNSQVMTLSLNYIRSNKQKCLNLRKNTSKIRSTGFSVSIFFKFLDLTQLYPSDMLQNQGTNKQIDFMTHPKQQVREQNPEGKEDQVLDILNSNHEFKQRAKVENCYKNKQQPTTTDAI